MSIKTVEADAAISRKNFSQLYMISFKICFLLRLPYVAIINLTTWLTIKDRVLYGFMLANSHPLSARILPEIVFLNVSFPMYSSSISTAFIAEACDLSLNNKQPAASKG